MDFLYAFAEFINSIIETIKSLVASFRAMGDEKNKE